MYELQIFKLGSVSYKTALELQLSLLEKRKNDEIGDTLLLLEHPPVFTIGRSGNKDEHLLASPEELNNRLIQFEEISRGGDITFHGPGQLVGYPIFDLARMNRDIHKYLRNLEQVIIRSLADFGINGRRFKGVTGVWVKSNKIASIGVGVKRWITYHGFALNVNTDLSYFDMIVPCGIPNVSMTSIQRWLATTEKIDMARVEDSIVKAFAYVFERNISLVIPVDSRINDGDFNSDFLLKISRQSENH